MAENETDDRTRQLAHSLWEAAGQPEGEDLRFWYEAERQMKGKDLSGDELEEGLEESFPASDAPAAVRRHET